MKFLEDLPKYIARFAVIGTLLMALGKAIAVFNSEFQPSKPDQ